MFLKPISWFGMEKNLTQQKHTFSKQNKCTTTQKKHKKLKSGLVASYDIRPIYTSMPFPHFQKKVLKVPT